MDRWGRLSLENVVFSVCASVRRAVVVASSGTSTIAPSCATNELTLDRNFEDRAVTFGVRKDVSGSLPLPLVPDSVKTDFV